ncbi:cleavage stimulation factor subunit 2 [Tetranychus urticae]|uniref:RRM domain-containing protein n=1 Tax=Tetranychus urticae TaxID=32264 RepID=T1K5M0_TETUR|nr:cleavage stimulation factor subunit 2 [Tetranychus urticae]
MAAILNSNERSLRSVFVGNIPYDATEEKLKELFSQAGPVLSFRLVYDRETGKPKGYGFCEYKDQETALSAMRNLNGHELNGRTLRVDNAANERTKEEIRNLQSSLGGTFESPYGPEVDPERAPEAISKAVASLPPEQMFELAKQMKQCIQTNPNEARNMLLQNPQLSYALLQAIVVMKIVDPNVALSILHRSTPVANVIPEPVVVPPMMGVAPVPTPGVASWPQPGPVLPDNYVRGVIPPAGQPVAPPPVAPPVASGVQFDPRSLDPRSRESTSLDPRARPQGSGSQPPFDPRLAAQSPASGNNRPGGPPPTTSSSRMNAPSSSVNIPNLPNQEQEKAALIMQVLQLSDQQIAMLPAEQRQSIQLLKEQISRGATH